MTYERGPLRRSGWAYFLWAAVILSSEMALAQEAPASVRQWRRIEVSGATCGDGQPYAVFISAGDPRKIAFDLMGGGACWDEATCNALPAAWVHPVPKVLESGGFVSADPARSPVAGHTLVYFPYCTGDVHLGTHVAHYLPGSEMHHVGGLNFPAAVKQLVDEHEIDLAHAQQFVMTGFSAGALGALYHVLDLAPLLRQVPDKVLIADAPGLHFGKSFWGKFPPELLADFSAALGRLGMPIAQGEGNLAALVPQLCHALPDWRVGVLQGSKDVVMSSVFGAINPGEHEKLIYGPTGMFSYTQDPGDNCSAWVPSTPMHTFLVTDITTAIRASTGESALDYIRNLVSGVWDRGDVRGAGPNYR